MNNFFTFPFRMTYLQNRFVLIKGDPSEARAKICAAVGLDSTGLAKFAFQYNDKSWRDDDSGKTQSEEYGLKEISLAEAERIISQNNY